MNHMQFEVFYFYLHTYFHSKAKEMGRDRRRTLETHESWVLTNVRLTNLSGSSRSEGYYVIPIG